MLRAHNTNIPVENENSLINLENIKFEGEVNIGIENSRFIDIKNFISTDLKDITVNSSISFAENNIPQ